MGRRVINGTVRRATVIKGMEMVSTQKTWIPARANHTDAVFMSKRTDRELVDAVSGGGRAVGKASIMPPWGRLSTSRRLLLWSDI